MQLNHRDKWIYRNLKEKQYLLDLAAREGLIAKEIKWECPGILEIDRVKMQIKPSKKNVYTHRVEILMDQVEVVSASTASMSRETFLEALIEMQDATIQKLFDTNRMLMDELRNEERAIG